MSKMWSYVILWIAVFICLGERYASYRLPVAVKTQQGLPSVLQLHSHIHHFTTSLYSTVESTDLVPVPTKEEEDAAMLALVERMEKKLVVSSKSVGGRVLVTGLGQSDEDEFALTLLNDQNVWDQILLGATDLNQARKRLLSRSARYSGLLNLLEFTEVHTPNPSEDNQEVLTKHEEQLKASLQGMSAWLAYDVSPSQILSLAATALALKIPRVIFTTQLAPDQVEIPEFAQVKQQFEEAGLKFTGIKHGQIIAGSEDVPYRIVNATAPLQNGAFVTRGVLARVASELLNIDDSFNQECGLESCSLQKVVVDLEDAENRLLHETPNVYSSEFISAYLGILRSSGLTRQEEVYKIFKGGLQRVTEVMDAQYRLREEEKKRKIAAKEAAKLAEIREQTILANRRTQIRPAKEDEDDEDFATRVPKVPLEDRIQSRTEEILQRVWVGLNSRMYTRYTSKETFFKENQDKAKALARKEIEEEDDEKTKERLRRRASLEVPDSLLDEQRRQYGKLLALERRELKQQKQRSEYWIKYVYILLEITMGYYDGKKHLFHNLDSFQQAVVIRGVATMLRAKLLLPPHVESVYDPLDANIIVRGMQGMFPFTKTNEEGQEVAMTHEEVCELVEKKYGKLIRSNPMLMGSSQIVDLAIQTLKKAMPTPPKSVSELKEIQSRISRAEVEQSRVEFGSNRARPKLPEDKNYVGKL